MSESWKLTLPCTRMEAEALDADFTSLAALEPPPVLMTREVQPDDPDNWQLEAYFEGRPDDTAIAAVRALLPSAADATPLVELLPEKIG